jgi:uncharacterized delta-60 repeat protein
MSNFRRASGWAETWTRIATLAALLTLLIPAAARAAPGDLDPSFGQDGYAAVQTNRACLRGCVEFGGSYADALALQPDGGIVLGGYNVYLGAPHDGEELPGALVRLRANGTLDTAFGGSGGIVDTPFRVTEIHANERGGLRVSGAGKQGFGIQRYTSTGALDGFYGTHGVRWLPNFDGGQRDSTGRILKFTTFIVPATDYIPAVRKLGITRLLPSGERDTRFGHKGYISLPTGTEPLALVPQQDESVLLAFATESRVALSKESHIFLERLTQAGKLDRSFGTRGIAQVPLKGVFAGGALFLAPNGDILIAGGEQRGTNLQEGDDYLILAIYTQSGRPDHHFGNDGITRSHIPTDTPYVRISPRAIAFDSLGDAIVVGENGMRTVDTPAGDGFLARFTPRGRDCAFGVGGVAIDKHMGGANAVALQPDGRIVIAGWGGGFLAARYLGGAARTCAG